MHLPARTTVLTSLLLTLLSAPTLSAAAKPKDAILLSQVESLTLRGDRQTSHRRVSAVPQLKCISHPSICAKHAVDIMRCENKGAGYGEEDIQWSCSAQLPPELKLGSTDVICEGYSSADDPYILKGSCGVEYRLVLTPEGESRWPDLGHGGLDGGSGGGDWFPYLFWAIFVAVLGWIIYSACMESLGRGGGGGNNRRAPRRNNGGGGGGGHDPWDDPPPPYPGTGGGYGRGTNTRKTGGGSGSRKSSPQGGGGWQNSLLSGAAGAAAGYYMGNRGRNNNGEGSSRNYGSTWGSGGGAGPSRSGSSGSSSGSAASNSRYESTGFGSTSRR